MFERSGAVEYRHLNLIPDAQISRQNKKLVALLDFWTLGFKGIE